MDSQVQLQRTHAHHQAEKPIKINHPEEEGHHQKGPLKVVKKVKEKAKKIKNALTKHGHGHEHGGGQHIPDDHDLDEEDDYDDYGDQEIHAGAPVQGKGHLPVKENIVSPGGKALPVVSSSHTRPTELHRGVGNEALSHPVRPSGVSETEGRRGASTLTPNNTPVSLLSATEDITRTFVPGDSKCGDHSRVNIERPRGLEEDSTSPRSRGGTSNFQSKVTDPTGKAEEIGAASSLTTLGRWEETGKDDQLGLGRDLQVKSHGFDKKSEPEMGRARNYGSGLRKESLEMRHDFDMGRDFPTRTQGLRNPEDFDSKTQERGYETQQSNQSSYTDKIASATAAVADKAMAAKNAVASKLGYSGEGGEHENRAEGENVPSSTGGYGNNVAGMVTPVYEKVKETGANVMTKLPFTGSGAGTETGQNKGLSAKEYLTEKLSPGEEDKVLSEVVAEKLHLGETEPAKKGIVTQSEEVEKRLGGFTDQKSDAARKQGEAFAEGGEGGMVDKLRGAVTSWISGTTEEVTQNTTQSIQDSSVSLGNTVGKNMGLSGSGGDEAGQRGSVPLQKRFHESGN